MSNFDTDGDGYIDTTAMDTEGDGVADTYSIDTNDDMVVDATGFDPNQDGSIDVYALDTNQDGLSEGVLGDTNLDGYMDTLAVDLDENGLAEQGFIDADGDGSLETQFIDTDGDGLADSVVAPTYQEDAIVGGGYAATGVDSTWPNLEPSSEPSEGLYESTTGDIDGDGIKDYNDVMPTIDQVSSSDDDHVPDYQDSNILDGEVF